MALITLQFTNPLSTGIQVGDIAWYKDVSANMEVRMGPIVSITQFPTAIVVDVPAGTPAPATEDFIFFAVDPIAKVSSLKGYFAEAQFVNRYTKYAELFAVGAEVFESSK